MDHSRFLLLIQMLVIFHVVVNVSTSSVNAQNVDADFGLSDSNRKLPCSGGSESVLSAVRKLKEDEACLQSVKKVLKRSSRTRGPRRGGIPMVSDSGKSYLSEDDTGSHEQKPVGSEVRAQAATVKAHKAFQSYLERSDYFHSHHLRDVPSAKMPSLRGHTDPTHSSIPLGRRKITSTAESAPGRPVDNRNLEQNSKVLEEPFMVLVVSQSGDGDFTTVQDAVDFVQVGNSQRVIIRIHAGIYRERVVVPHNKPYITFHGDDTRSTIITWNATAASRVALGNGSWNASSDLTLFGTMQSASVTVLSDNFIAQDIAFQNSAPAPKPGAESAQAVAFLIAGDSAAFYDCSFLGAQDTLYDYKGRHYYHKCFIQGSIDFIFGSGRTLFENCTLSSIATRFGAIAAHQRHSPDEDTGFAFVGCFVTGTGSVYLGRAWSPFAKIVFAHSYFEDIIDAEGWSDFGDPERHRTTFFGLYECSGPGANPAHLVPWSRNLTVDEVRPFLSENFVNGQEWLLDPGYNTTLPQNSTFP